MKFRNRSEFVITPSMRITHRQNARHNAVQKLKDGHAFQFPWTYAKDVMGALGMPLEGIRWINQNDHRIPTWIKAKRDALKTRYHEFLIARYVIKVGAYSIGTEDELREFVASMKEIKSEYGSTWRRKWNGARYWYTEPGDKIVNREIVEPKTNGEYLAGATGFRFDDDFFMFAVLPYRFREIPIETVMSILFPNVPVSEYEFIPDSGSPELEAHMRENWLRSEAIRMIGDRHPRGFWDDAKATTRDGIYTVTLLRDDMVVATETVAEDVIVAYVDLRTQRYG